MNSIAAMTTQKLSYETVDAGNGQKPEMVVILCHGFGAPGTDLVPLGHHLLAHPGLQKRVRFIFPQGPLSLREWGYGDARAWWMIDSSRLMALQTGDKDTLHRMRQDTPEGLPLARRLLLALLDDICRDTGLGTGQIVLGGFSQGAMLTTDVALRLEEAPLGLAVLSGTVISENEWQKRAHLRKGLHVFQGHGRQDPILPYEGAEALREVFASAQMPHEFFPFNGGHTITEEELQRLASFLKNRLEALAQKKATTVPMVDQ